MLLPFCFSFRSTLNDILLGVDTSKKEGKQKPSDFKSRLYPLELQITSLRWSSIDSFHLRSLTPLVNYNDAIKDAIMGPFLGSHYSISAR